MRKIRELVKDMFIFSIISGLLPILAYNIILGVLGM